MNAVKPGEKRLSKPVKTTRGDLIEFNRKAWYYMKKTFNLTDTDLINLKAARCPAKVNNMSAYLFRYFNPEVVQQKGLTINDYECLNEHPELILYEGYQVLGKGGDLLIKERDRAGLSLLGEKIKSGEITEIGVVIEKTGAQKFLGGFEHFLMMGGFLIILVVIIVIVIAIVILISSC
jgi:hypothetical protein